MQHFLLSAKAKTLTLASVFRMSDEEAENLFRELRWPRSNGEPFCDECGCVGYECRRMNSAPRFRCSGCKRDFSITTGTPFASHKLPLRTYLAAIAIFCNEVKGKSMLALSRDLGVSYKVAFVLCHKLRECMEAEQRTVNLCGTCEVDGAYFGGHRKPHNELEKRVDRRLAEEQTGKRQVVVTMRQRQGRTVTGVFAKESDAVPAIIATIPTGSIVHADESSAWERLHAYYDMRRINHSIAFSKDGACTNQAESFFSRMRRAEIGHHHHLAGKYLHRFAAEASWREDHRRMANGAQCRTILASALAHSGSEFAGYWQRYQTKAGIQ